MQQGDQVRVFPPRDVQASVHLEALALRPLSTAELFRAQLPAGGWWWGTDLTVFAGLLTWQDCFPFRADWVTSVTHAATMRESDLIGRILPDQADRLPGTWAA